MIFAFTGYALSLITAGAKTDTILSPLDFQPVQCLRTCFVQTALNGVLYQL